MNHTRLKRMPWNGRHRRPAMATAKERILEVLDENGSWMAGAYAGGAESRCPSVTARTDIYVQT